MVNKKLAEWIKTEEAQGYSEQQLRNYLIDKKYNSKEIEEAIALTKEHRKIDFKEIFKPTPLKLFFPILFLIVILTSHLVNTSYAPALGELICDSFNFALESEQNLFPDKQTYDKPPELTIKELESKVEKASQKIEQAKKFNNLATPLLLGNVYFFPTFIYKLNPFFPVSCEWTLFESKITPSPRCSYYIEEKEYNCILKAQEAIKDLGSNNPASLDLLNAQPPEYQKINLIDFLLNMVVLVAIIYFIVCLCSLLLNILIYQKKSTKVLWTILAILLSIVFAYIFNGTYLIIVFILTAIVSLILFLFSFIQTASTRKKILYTISVILVLLLITGLIVTGFLFNKVMKATSLVDNSPTNFEVVYCPNPIEIPEEKIEVPVKELPGTPKWCGDPGCNELCREKCPKNTGFSINAGTNPYCVCYCKD